METQLTRASIAPGGGPDQDDFEPLLAELIALSRGKEVTAAAIDASTPHLLRLGHRFRQQHPGDYPDDASAAVALLRAALPGIDYEAAQAVDGALGLTVRGNSKAARRTATGSHRSRATLDRDEKRGLPLLTSRVIALTAEPGITAPKPVLAETALPFVVTHYSALYRMKPGRLVDVVTFELSFRAVEAGRLAYLSHNTYFNDRTPGILRTEALFGCKLVAETTEGDTQLGTLEFTRDLERGDTHTIAYLLRCSSTEPMLSTVYSTPDTDVDVVTLGIEFDRSDLPCQPVRFTNVPPLRAKSRDVRRANGEPLVERPTIIEEWYGLKQGMCCGLDWLWAGDHSAPLAV